MSTARAQAPLVDDEVQAPGQPFTANVRLSDEKTLTRYAYARERAPIRRAPGSGSPRIGKLRFQTEDGFAEPYLLLRTAIDDRGRGWIQLRVPGRPNGRKGWVANGTLGKSNIVRTHLSIDRSDLRAVLYRDGKEIWSSRIGVGKPGTPTPAGRFHVRERFAVSKRGTIYGRYAFGTSAYSILSDWPGGGIVGIHGTNQPELIPGRPSHGCVRVPNAAIMRLSRLMPVGTPITIV